MAEGNFQEKTEQASPKKKEEARKKGQVARSQELNSAIVMLTGLGVIYFLIDDLLMTFTSLFKTVYSEAGTFEISLSLVDPFVLIGLNIYSQLFAPIALTIMVVGVLVSYAQVGSVFSIEAMTPKFEKISPLKGFKRIFSQRSLVELVNNLIKLSLIGTIGYVSINSSFDEFMLLSNSDIDFLISFIGGMIMKIAVNISLALLFLAILDFSYQRWKFNQDLKMTKQEVREEHKQTEGDPLLKARIRSIQRENARKRMLQDVPEADVIITNPTTYAIALKYDITRMSAPIVVAKGMRKVAERIKEIAEENNIPVIENKWLAKTLFKSVEVGEETPYDLYKAVAEILAYIYKLKEA